MQGRHWGGAKKRVIVTEGGGPHPCQLASAGTGGLVNRSQGMCLRHGYSYHPCFMVNRRDGGSLGVELLVVLVGDMKLEARGGGPAVQQS